jgi:polyhydroxybutyrate depolymerase
VRAVIDDISAHFPVDPRRIYATGISNGGILSYRLACEMADRLAAIDSVAGTQNLPGCAPSAPVAILHIHGTADQHLPFEGGYGPESLAGVDFASVAESINFWLKADQCPAEARVEVSGRVTHTTYAPCAAGTAVELYAIDGGGHAWPGGIAAWQGGDPPPMELSATDVLWSFFAAHPKP